MKKILIFLLKWLFWIILAWNEALADDQGPDAADLFGIFASIGTASLVILAICISLFFMSLLFPILGIPILGILGLKILKIIITTLLFLYLFCGVLLNRLVKKEFGNGLF